ncbi:Methionine aminopeptidase 1 [Anaerotruncus sp. 2789STDY5834896]|uniref:Methionine aminopeptidase n=1 Tax=uncultured Anaerotruncus sp. TaxID=905011 RepID=A0A1C6IL23_9FIRM|nr:Methionine aminopeptidase 1 [uncultured Anaerotruncus sp.]
MITLRSAKEISDMKAACKLSAEALALAGSLVAPGVTTREIDAKVKKFITSHGAKPSFLGYGGFPGSACISINEQIIHGIPGDRVIEEGDIVSVDVGAFYKGYHGDNAATFGAGKVSPAAQKLMDATRESLLAGIEAAQPGNRIGDIGHAVETYVTERGYSVVRDFIGHGVGHELHEDPEVPNYGRAGHGPRLTPGMTIAIEPMVNEFGSQVEILKDGWTVITKDGGLSAHFEHTIAITASGPVILTAL